MKKVATQKIANPKIKFLLAVLIALLVVGGILCIIFFKQQAAFNAHSNGMIQGENITEKNADSIAIPGYEGLTLKADTLQQTVSLNNPEQNACLFIIGLYLEDGTMLWQSDYIEPGSVSSPIVLIEALPKGTYHAVLRYSCFKMDSEKTPLNGAETKLTLRVK